VAENEELDAQTLEEDLTNLDGQEPETEEAGTTEPEVEPEVKTGEDEAIKKALRGENARRRVENRELKARLADLESGKAPQQAAPQPVPGQVYDPRVDDMLLENKINSIKKDEYFKELFTDVVDENTGMTFEEKLLETASREGWPIKELDALAMKMERNKLLGGAKQRGIDETYKSLKEKREGSAVKTTASGKPVSGGDDGSLEGALNKTMEELGVDDISKI